MCRIHNLLFMAGISPQCHKGTRILRHRLHKQRSMVRLWPDVHPNLRVCIFRHPVLRIPDPAALEKDGILHPHRHGRNKPDYKFRCRRPHLIIHILPDYLCNNLIRSAANQQRRRNMLGSAFIIHQRGCCKTKKLQKKLRGCLKMNVNGSEFGRVMTTAATIICLLKPIILTK